MILPLKKLRIERTPFVLTFDHRNSPLKTAQLAAYHGRQTVEH